MNKVILMGRLTKDPDVRYSQSATPIAVARYTLAVNRRFKRQGEQEEDFINCVALGKSGEFAEKYFKKGQMVSIVGRLQARSWEDNEGKKRYATEVVVEEQYFAESKASAESNRKADAPKQPSLPDGFYPAEPNAAAPSGWFAEQTSADPDIEDDDMPF